jgi:hypothetical protein
MMAVNGHIGGIAGKASPADGESEKPTEDEVSRTQHDIRAIERSARRCDSRALNKTCGWLTAAVAGPIAAFYAAKTISGATSIEQYGRPFAPNAHTVWLPILVTVALFYAFYKRLNYIKEEHHRSCDDLSAKLHTEVPGGSQDKMC